MRRPAMLSGAIDRRRRELKYLNKNVHNRSDRMLLLLRNLLALSAKLLRKANTLHK